MRAILLLLSIWAASAFAENVNEWMQDAGDTMLRMLPEVASGKPDRVKLTEGLVRLDYLFEQAKPHLDRRGSASRVTYTMLREDLKEAIELSTGNNVQLLQRAVGNAFEICASCHTQDKHIIRAFGVSKIRALDDYLAGEFSFLTRDYPAALVSYEDYLDGDSRTPERDARVVERILVITAEVDSDPALAKSTLASIQPRLKSTPTIEKRVAAWVRVLDRLSEDPGLQSPLDKKSVAQLDGFLAREWPALQATLSVDAQEAYWIVIRGELTRQLARAEGTRDVPILLYWLAVTDRSLHYRFYNSLTRGYLERCVRGYPGDPYAKKCFDEYEMLVLVSFSGSAGTNIPFEVQEELNTLRKLAYGK